MPEVDNSPISNMVSIACFDNSSPICGVISPSDAIRGSHPNSSNKSSLIFSEIFLFHHFQ